MRTGLYVDHRPEFANMNSQRGLSIAWPLGLGSGRIIDVAV